MAFYYDESKLRNPVLKELIKEIMDTVAGHDHDGANSKAVSVGTVSDLAVTNAKLAADVKVGSLAALTTTSKASVQSAINELVTNMGALASLSTTEKTSLVLAINEIVTNSGNVATLTTVSKVLVGAINELNAANAAFATKTGVETLTNKSITSPVLATPKIADGDTGVTITSTDQTNAAAVVTIPDIADAADEFVCKDTEQTLTLKTLTTPIISTFYKDAAKTKLMTVPDVASDTVALVAAEQTLTNKSLTAPAVTEGVATHDYAAGAVDWTLSASELKAKYLVVTNANAPAAIIGPSTSGKTYIVVNNSGQAITIKKAAGTGIAVADTKVAEAAYIGSDYIRITADA